MMIDNIASFPHKKRNKFSGEGAQRPCLHGSPWQQEVGPATVAAPVVSTIVTYQYHHADACTLKNNTRFMQGCIEIIECTS